MLENKISSSFLASSFHFWDAVCLLCNRIVYEDRTQDVKHKKENFSLYEIKEKSNFKSFFLDSCKLYRISSDF